MATDLSQRFIFEETDIRGDLVQLRQSYKDILAVNDYPDIVAKLIGEFLVASVLLSSTIKFRGRLILQARSQGEIPLLMVEATEKREIRGIARLSGAITSSEFSSLFREGSLVVTIDPEKGERYQSLVPLTGDNLASCLEYYFDQSEQLRTFIKLTADGEQAAGLLLQQLPGQLVPDEQARSQQWQHVAVLGGTVKTNELVQLDAKEILGRLYVEDNIRLFSLDSVAFRCSCSRERTGSALIALGSDELESLFEESGRIVISCEFCSDEYEFDRASLAKLVRGNKPTH